MNVVVNFGFLVETCKKRWKYLRERYVSQRKQGDPPVYEHLSRPYLEKMKFLDSHIQPRKSYRNVPNFLTSPHSANSSNFNDYNMDSKSNSSMKSMGHFGQHGHHFADQQHAMSALSSAAAAASALEGESRVKLEADQVFRDFAAAVASQHLQQISQSQMQHQQSVAAAMAADSPQNYNDHFRETAGPVLSAVVGGAATLNGSSTGGNTASGLHSSSSSSIKSPLSSPMGVSTHHNGTSNGHSTPSTQQAAAHSSTTSTPNNNAAATNNSNHNFNNHSFNDSHNDDMDSSTSSNYNMKKPRVQLNASTANISASSHLHHNSSHHSSHGSINNSANNTHFVDDSEDEDTDDNSSSLLQPQGLLNEHHSAENPFQTMAASTSGASLNRSHSNSSMNNQNNINNHNNISQSPSSSNMFSSNADFLFQLYQQLPQHNHSHQQQHNSNVSPTQQFNKFQVPPTPQPTVQRSSEHLLGELVTTELLKMSKERRKNVQKRILEILFFDD